MTAKQIKDVLVALRDFSHWMYYAKNSLEEFNSQVQEHNGKRYSIKILPTGDYSLTELSGGKTMRILPIIIPHALKEGRGIENYEFKYQLAKRNADDPDLSEEEMKDFNEVAIFILNAFQRTICFTYFCRMHDDTIDQISGVLASGFKPEAKTEKGE